MTTFKPLIRRAFRSTGSVEAQMKVDICRDPLTVMREKHARIVSGIVDEGFSLGTALSYANQTFNGYKTQAQKPRSLAEAGRTALGDSSSKSVGLASETRKRLRR